MHILTNLRDCFFRRGIHAATLPPMDGVLRPHTALDSAPTLFDAALPDQLQADGAKRWFSIGASICMFDGEGSSRAASNAAPVTAFARDKARTAF